MGSSDPGVEACGFESSNGLFSGPAVPSPEDPGGGAREFGFTSIRRGTL